MRQFIKKLQESVKGNSGRKINERELNELKEYMENKGYVIVASKKLIYLSENEYDHVISRSLTEADALRLFKNIMPDKITKKTPAELRFKNKK